MGPKDKWTSREKALKTQEKTTLLKKIESSNQKIILNNIQELSPI